MTKSFSWASYCESLHHLSRTIIANSDSSLLHNNRTTILRVDRLMFSKFMKPRRRDYEHRDVKYKVESIQKAYTYMYNNFIYYIQAVRKQAKALLQGYYILLYTSNWNENQEWWNCVWGSTAELLVVANTRKNCLTRGTDTTADANWLILEIPTKYYHIPSQLLFIIMTVINICILI